MPGKNQRDVTSQRLTQSLAKLVRLLEKNYGSLQARWPTDAYSFLIWWHCGYPASDAACDKGWHTLKASIGTDPVQILAASHADLTKALKPGGMVPELRAVRLKEIAALIQDQFAGDLHSALVGPLPQVRKMLKKFPGIADPGADRILLFAGVAPIAAVPSNCVHVVVRLLRGREHENYGLTYRESQAAIEAEFPRTFEARQHVYLLIKEHGQKLCKRTNPKCSECPIRDKCAYFAGIHRGRGTLKKRQASSARLSA